MCDIINALYRLQIGYIWHEKSFLIVADSMLFLEINLNYEKLLHDPFFVSQVVLNRNQLLLAENFITLAHKMRSTENYLKTMFWFIYILMTTKTPMK